MFVSEQDHIFIYTINFSELLFASINDADFCALSNDRTSDLDIPNIYFDPLDILDNEYNDLYVNAFYVQTRHMNIPQSEYIFLD